MWENDKMLRDDNIARSGVKSVDYQCLLFITIKNSLYFFKLYHGGEQNYDHTKDFCIISYLVEPNNKNLFPFTDRINIRYFIYLCVFRAFAAILRQQISYKCIKIRSLILAQLTTYN